MYRVHGSLMSTLKSLKTVKYSTTVSPEIWKQLVRSPPEFNISATSAYASSTVEGSCQPKVSSPLLLPHGQTASKSALSNESNPQTPIIHKIWKLAMPNFEEMKQQSSKNVDLAKAIVKDAQNLNSRLGKMTKSVETIRSIIDRLQPGVNDGLGLNQISSNKPNSSSFWISVGSGLYIIIMEKLPKLFLHFKNSDLQDE